LDNIEIMLNLWYIYDDLGAIYSLRARTYIGYGSEKEKLDLLRQLAVNDYLIAQPFPIPEKYHVFDSNENKLPVFLVQALPTIGGAFKLFEDAFKILEDQLPSQTSLFIPQKPLVCITPIFADADGKLHLKNDRQEFIT
jgi:hypothetical protein